MKILFCGICLTLLLSSHVWARDVNTVKVDVLAKTSSSWDGGVLPDYAKGKPEVMDSKNHNSSGGTVAAT